MNEIFLYGEVGSGYGAIDENYIRQELARVGNATDITLRINSPGGDVFSGIAIYSLLVAHPAKIHVVVDGLAASIASIIAMAGDTITMAGNSLMMVHSPLCMMYGNARELRTMADLLDKVQAEQLITTYVARTGQSTEKITELVNAETWLSASECLALGFATAVGDLKSVAPDAKWKNLLAKYSKTPKNLLASEKVESKEEEQVIDYSSYELDLALLEI